METLQARLAAIDEVLRDPPQVHVGAATAYGDVWPTDRDCYEFMARHCSVDSRTLETGLGVSTVLFAMWRTTHTCVVGDRGEVQRCEAYLSARDVAPTKLRFEVGTSDEVLPRLQPGPLDLVFVDGCHAFPMPIVDWYYAARHLRRDGVVVFDDVQLPHVSDGGLLSFLDRDPRWLRLCVTNKWAAYRKLADHTLLEEWTDQPFIVRSGARAQAQRLERRLKRIAKRALRR